MGGSTSKVADVEAGLDGVQGQNEAVEKVSPVDNLSDAQLEEVHLARHRCINEPVCCTCPWGPLRPSSKTCSKRPCASSQFFDAFNMFDKDGGGTIDAKELKDLLASVGQMPTDAELADMISAVDVDGTGDIDFTEFAALMAHKMQDDANSDATIAQAFKVFDQSGDGLISSGEMRRIMINLGEKVRNLLPIRHPCWEGREMLKQ